MKNESLLEIKNILEEEANVIARLSDDGAFKNMDHRASIAIMYEMRRLRRLASECGNEVEMSPK